MDGSSSSSMTREAVHVKQECEWTNSAESWGVSEAAARAGLYADHEIKRELVLGPEVLQPPDAVFTVDIAAHTNSHGGCGHCDHTYAARECPPVEVRVEVECVKEELEGEAPGRGGEQLALRDCTVKLERIHAFEALVGSEQSTSTTQAQKIPDAEKTLSNMKVTAEASYACAICRRTFALKSRLMEHVVVHIHAPPSPEQAVGRGAGAVPVLSVGARALACPRPRPQRHTHHTQPAAAEHTAPAHSQNTHSIENVHRRIHHAEEKPYSCEICTKQFKQSGSLNRHKLIHTNTKPYSCEICTKQFTRYDSLKTHKLIHTNTKSYSCEICTKQFTRLGNLYVHKLIHTYPKPYSCDICTEQFRRLDHLKGHKMIHANVKHYSSEIYMLPPNPNSGQISFA